MKLVSSLLFPHDTNVQIQARVIHFGDFVLNSSNDVVISLPMEILYTVTFLQSSAKDDAVIENIKIECLA